MRRLLLLVSAVVLVDSMFYAAVAPLLPHYADTLHLSKAAAGLLTAAYPAGTLVGSLPGGVLASRAGPRATVLLGLGLLSASSVVFGFGHTAWLLDSARFVQGLGGACSWCGGMAWLMSAAPAQQRGRLIGTAMGAAVAGSLFGPVVGTLARELSPAPVFSSVVVLAGGLAAAAVRTSQPAPGPSQGVAALLPALRRAPVLAAVWLVALPALAFGVLNVLGPLRLDALGAGGTAIGATYLVAAAGEASVSPVVGRVSDRLGRLAPLRAGLVVSAPLLVVFTLPRSAAAVAVLLVVLASAVGLFWAPAMAMLADQAEESGLDQGLGFALVNIAWAGGQVVGSSGGGALAQRTADAVPLGAVAVLFLATLALLLRHGTAWETAALVPAENPVTPADPHR